VYKLAVIFPAVHGRAAWTDGEADFMTTMIRVAELHDAVDRAREAIDDRRVFNVGVIESMFDFEVACADASHPLVVDDSDVRAACIVVTEAFTGLLFARAAAYRAGFLTKITANRRIHRAGLVADKALEDLKQAVSSARFAIDDRCRH
jgi:hypothetical protein